ncbi:lipopolysaccharide biosynthesis protein [Microbacterium sp. CFBP9034]|uniref:lipopolysaccharide biosynthesis protein n=1 Tax=Microbacterium sp. CFBP9034 TaxID=3096540 RepID=UPI002A6A2DD2|nr:lipopolysaccharide biosynthesis protein [Microbacterium sp. CFBP9034]MDY0910384.1 lipopolysaccharide biosynthesis protein [Microbacterium sp. CFBP9034]
MTGGTTTATLGESASRGAAVTIAGQVIRIVVQLGGIMILARLLTPADYGLLAMVTAIIGVGELVRDFGLSSAAIQVKHLTAGQKSNLFWINSSIGAALMLVTIGMSWLIAAFYGDDRLQPIAAALSVTFLLNGLSTQFRADLSRSLRFGRLVVIETSAQVIALAAGLALAFAGAGYWALVAQQIAQTLAAIVLLLILTGWFPGWVSRREQMRGLLAYGVNMFGTQVLNYASRNVDSIVIGARFGAADLGLYNRAFQLMMLPLQQLNAPSTRVALPVLSRIQDDRARYAAFLTFGQSALLTAVGALLALLGAQAESVITIMLGDQWLETIPIFRILLIAGFFQAAGYAAYWVFLSKGLMRQNLHYALVTRPLMIVAIIVGSIWGMTGVAIAYSACAALMWPLVLLWIHRTSDAPAGALLANGARAIVVYGTACIVSYFATIGIPSGLTWIRLLTGTAVLLAWMALVALIWPRYRRDLLSLLSARKLLRRRSRTATPAELTQREEDVEREDTLGAPHGMDPGDAPPPPDVRPEGTER